MALHQDDLVFGLNLQTLKQYVWNLELLLGRQSKIMRLS